MDKLKKFVCYFTIEKQTWLKREVIDATDKESAVERLNEVVRRHHGNLLVTVKEIYELVRF